MADTAGARARRAWLPLTAAAALLVAGGVLVSTAPGDQDAPRLLVPVPSPTSAQVASSYVSRPEVTAADGPVTRPRAVAVPALGVRTRVVPIVADGGVLTPPPDPRVVGWWSAGRRPGAPHGAAVLTGHTVHTGGGAFDDLEQLAPGDDVVVRTGRARLSYVVESVQVLDRAALARRSTRVFAQTGAARLVLITCEDWDGTAYRSNVVVTARPVGA